MTLTATTTDPTITAASSDVLDGATSVTLHLTDRIDAYDRWALADAAGYDPALHADVDVEWADPHDDRPWSERHNDEDTAIVTLYHR